VFQGGTDIGQWRPTPPAFSPMSAQAVAFTLPFVLSSAAQFQPPPPRTLNGAVFADDFNAVKTLGRDTGSTRTVDQTALAPFWEGNASVHWNQAANQIAGAVRLSMSESNQLLAALNVAMADTAITVWAAKRLYGANPEAVTWRPVTAIALAATDPNEATTPDPTWRPLVATPAHPEYPAGHPALNGAAATVLLSRVRDRQSFVLTTRTSSGQLPQRRYDSISHARSDGNEARVWGGMHYPTTVAISDALGAEIAGFVLRHSMQPRH
jgi:membrane-associated phospholipid phosphatase